MKTIPEIKEELGFRKEGPKCGNCVFFTSKIIQEQDIWNTTYKEEKEKRCTFKVVYIFAVGKSNWCEKHQFAKH